MGAVGDAYYNTMSERFFATIGCALLDLGKFKTKAEAGITIFQFIEGRQNPGLRHSALGHMSPISCERSCHETLENASP